MTDERMPLAELLEKAGEGDSQCSLDITALPQNVSWVLPSLQASWGKFSVVEAAVQALKLLYSTEKGPDWFVLLSGSDYPIKPAAQVYRNLSTSPYDAHMSHEWIRPGHSERPWQRLCYDRYFTKTGRLPPVFSDEFRCYAGEFWFCANRRSAETIVRFHSDQPLLARHYTDAVDPEESYFHCILFNSRELKVSNTNYRYTDWPDERALHPKTLDMSDLPSCWDPRRISPANLTATMTRQ